MKTLTMAVFTTSLFASTLALAQTTVTLETNSSGAQNISALHTEGNVFAFAQACEGGWWQAYAGLTHADNIGDVSYQLALGIGAEKFGSRYGGWLWVGEGKVSAIHLFEDGGSGPWHRTTLKAQVNDELALGLTDRSFYGRGVHAEYKLGNSSKLTGEYFDGGDTTLSYSLSF